MPSRPQVQVTAGNIAVVGVMALEIEQVGYFAADRFKVTLAMGAPPLGNPAFYAAMGSQTIVIGVAVAAAGYVNLLTGQIDNIRLDIAEGTVTLCGRDLSARLIDAEISQTFANQTASQIAAAIAARHGLTPNVTATTAAVGQYYELDHARSALALHSRNGSEWNMLTRLAMAEGFMVSVTGTALNFGPLPASVAVAMTPQDFIELSLDVATTIPVCAIVKSWNTRNKAMISQTAGGGTGNTTTLVRPNLTAAQAKSAAAQHLGVLGQHGTILIATAPGETALTPGGQIALSGTNSSLDRSYVIDVVSRSIDHAGFIETIYAHASAG